MQQNLKEVLNQSHYEELLKIFTDNEWAKGNITRTVKKFCEINGVPYNDSMRRKASNIFAEGMNQETVVEEEKNIIPHKAKILISDIETSFIKFYGFSPYNKYVHADNMIEDWFLLTTSSKWLHEEETIDFMLTEEELLRRNDRRLAEEMWKLLDEADFVVFYNGVKFDRKKLNAKFMQYGLGLPSPYYLIDPYLTVKAQFGLTYSGLDAVCKILGIDGKLENEKGLWHKVMNGDMGALERMMKYNVNDIIILEKVYLELRPYMNRHPNIGLYINEDSCTCPVCGSEDLDWNLKSDYVTLVNRYQAFRCNNCNSLGRSRTPLKIDKKNLTVVVAK